MKKHIKTLETRNLCDSAKNVDNLDDNTLKLYGNGESYELYTDDGMTTNVSLDNIRKIVR